MSFRISRAAKQKVFANADSHSYANPDPDSNPDANSHTDANPD